MWVNDWHPVWLTGNSKLVSVRIRRGVSLYRSEFNLYPPFQVFFILVIRTGARPFTHPNTIRSSFDIRTTFLLLSAIKIALLEILQ